MIHVHSANIIQQNKKELLYLWKIYKNKLFAALKSRQYSFTDKYTGSNSKRDHCVYSNMYTAQCSSYDSNCYIKFDI